MHLNCLRNFVGEHVPSFYTFHCHFNLSKLFLSHIVCVWCKWTTNNSLCVWHNSISIIVTIQIASMTTGIPVDIVCDLFCLKLKDSSFKVRIGNLWKASQKYQNFDLFVIILEVNFKAFNHYDIKIIITTILIGKVGNSFQNYYHCHDQLYWNYIHYGTKNR